MEGQRKGGMQQVEEVEQATAWEEEEVEQVEEEGQCNCMGGVGSVHCTGYLLLPSSLSVTMHLERWHAPMSLESLQYYFTTTRIVAFHLTSHTSQTLNRAKALLDFESCLYPSIPSSLPTFLLPLIRANHNNGADEAEFWQKAGLCTI